jgi:hypothetical protein
MSAVEHFHDGALLGIADERFRDGDELAFGGGHWAHSSLAVIRRPAYRC